MLCDWTFFLFSTLLISGESSIFSCRDEVASAHNIAIYCAFHCECQLSAAKVKVQLARKQTQLELWPADCVICTMCVVVVGAIDLSNGVLQTESTSFPSASCSSQAPCQPVWSIRFHYNFFPLGKRYCITAAPSATKEFSFLILK